MVTKRTSKESKSAACTLSSATSTRERQKEIDAAIESIKAIRKRTGKISVQEILSARHEGHKY